MKSEQLTIKLPLHTVSTAAKFVGTSYHKLKWAISNGQVNPVLFEPVILIEEIELIRYKRILENIKDDEVKLTA